MADTNQLADIEREIDAVNAAIDQLDAEKTAILEKKAALAGKRRALCADREQLIVMGRANRRLAKLKVEPIEAEGTARL